MEILLSFIIAALIAYAVFKDVLYHRHLEKLEQKLLAKDLTDYKVNTEKVDPEDDKSTFAAEEDIVELDQIPNPFLKDSQ